MTEPKPKKTGFRSRNPYAMTAAERQSKRRRANITRQVQLTLTNDVAAALVYVRKEWGMKSSREAIEASLRFLALCTRQGLQRLPQTIDD